MPSEDRSPGIQDVIGGEIRSSGRISFRRFMEICLYHPQGYYSSEKVRLGKAGDFYTSAHAGPVFARLLASHLQRLWIESGKPSCFQLIELGPADGLLAGELMAWIGQRFDELSASFHYVGLEQSAWLRTRLAERLNPFGERARTAASWEEARDHVTSGHGSLVCIFANEFFDALPFHILVWRNGRWRERYVCLEGGRLAWCEGDPSSPELAGQAGLRFAPGLRLAEREEGWIAEISPAARGWMQKIAGVLLDGAAGSQTLIVDYGYTIKEWQQGRFPEGSALAYRRHRVVEDLLANPGDQDITAHVNFSELMEEGQAAGLRLEAFISQSTFLMELGREDEFRDVFAGCVAEAERLRRAQLLKTLVLPQGMGEAFRVLQMSPPGGGKKI